MKYLGIKQLICAIISLVQTLYYCMIFILYNIIRFLWCFKVDSWYEFYYEPVCSTFYFRNGYGRTDKNPIECFVRLYKFYTGTYYE